MTRKNRILSLVLVVAMLASLLGMLSVSAATPEALDITALANAAGNVVTTLEGSITAAEQDVDGVYYGVNYPASLSVGSYTVPTEDFILMAANALNALSEGKTAATQIAYKDVAIEGKDVKNGAGTSLNKAQYLELAERVSKYGNTTAKLATSYNRPTDGTNAYEGRVTIYTIGHIFAKALAAYKTAGQLPATVEFLPIHYGEVEVTPTEKPAEPEDWFAAVIDASVLVKASMLNDGVIPGTIYIGNVAVTPAQYIYLASQVVYALNNGQTSGDLSVPTLNEPEHPQGATTGRLYLYDYPDMARRIAAFCDNNQQPPNYCSSSDLGAIHYYACIEMVARALAFYKSDGQLPNYVTLSGFSGTVGEIATPTTAKPTTAPTTASTSGTTPTAPTEPVANDWYPKVIEAAVALEAYVKEKGVLPGSITVNGKTCTYAQFMYLACEVILGLNNGQTSGELSVPTTKEPANPSETLTSGTFQKAELIDLAGRSIKFMDNNGGLAANYMITSLGNMHHHNAVYLYARMLSYYAANGTLPTSMSVIPWAQTVASVPGQAAFGNDFSSYSKYLVPTKNCYPTNATLIAVAKTGMYYTGGDHGAYPNPSTTYEAMFNLMEYLNDMTSYDSYMNSSRGGLKTWTDKMGNCCDMAHLYNSCARALGVPAKYEHWNCTFSSTTTGHVWASVLCPDAPKNNINGDGYWLWADMVNNPNYLGYQNHRNNFNYNDLGDKAQLPW